MRPPPSSLIVPTPALGDSSNRIAPTAFVMRLFNDTSSVIGSPATVYNPLYFGNPGTGIVDRFNRVLVGEATAASSDVGPITTKDWLETLVANSVANSQFASVSAIGELGVTGGSRTGDFRTAFGSASGGSQGVSGFAYNNDTGSGNPIAVGIFGLCLHANSVTGISENELTIASNATTVDINPFSGVVGGNTISLNLSCGFSGFTNNVSAALIFGTSVTAKFRKGIVALNGGLDGAIGQGGAGVAFEVADGMSQRWMASNGTTTIAEIWATSGLNGLLLYGSNIEFAHSANWVANGTTATSVTSLGPAGSHTAVQVWFTVVDNTGARRWIPAF